MVGTAGDVLALLETVRKGGAPILKASTVAQMMKDQVGPQAATQGPGWGFGYGWAVLDDPAAGKTPQGAGTMAWGGVYGHNWFVDAKTGLTVVIMKWMPIIIIRATQKKMMSKPVTSTFVGR